MSTPIDFLAYVMKNLKIDNLTQELLVGPAFNLLKGTCRSRVELEYHFKECYKVVTNRMDWNNPKGKEYPFQLSKPLPMVKDLGRQVVPIDYFINNDLEYLKGGSLNRKYMTSTTKTKAAKYDDIQGIEDMWYEYGYLEEIEVQKEDQKLYKFKEGNFPRLNLHDIEDMLLLLVQKLMRTDELYKFNDGTLTSVRTVLHDIASNLRMDYLLKRIWSKLDKKRSRIMIKAIDQQLFERRLMRNLEKFVGGRDCEEDLRLLQQTI
ncbi:hypothetical protein Tco_0697917 [Tanacetum coccineum]